MTFPSWISAAPALVTAGVMRLVAPVWSFGPQGDAGTSFLQSDWAKAAEPAARTISAAAIATIARSFMAGTPSRQCEGHAARRGADAGGILVQGPRPGQAAGRGRGPAHGAPTGPRGAARRLLG